MSLNRFFLAYLFFAAIVVSVYIFFISPPTLFPQNSTITIENGSSVGSAADVLKEKNIVRSSNVFSAAVRLFEGHRVVAGTYALTNKEDVFTLANRFAHGKTGIVSVKVTFPEGVNVREMTEILSRSLGTFDSKKFIELATPYEGYLFPETYFIKPDTSAESIVALMRETFDGKIQIEKEKILAFGKTEKEVITMASILEREGRQSETRRMIAGILWKRLQLGMPLQVDAVFGYILGKSGYDLKLNSPYNTYLHKGLPPTPIGNPGLSSIEDALAPTKNPYLYYLTDKEGSIYYAKTFAEHVANKAKARTR